MKDIIYNQRKIPKKQWRYGLRSSAATGCGWIATYNALVLMGYDAEPEQLIRYYEHQLPLLNGNTGTFILGPALYFKQKGFGVRISNRRARYDEIAKESDVCILFYFWRNKFKFGAHFVTVRYQEGKFIGYNTYSNSTGPDSWGISVEGFLKKNKKFGSVMMAINKNQQMR